MISYNTVNVKMPAIRRRDTSAWVKAVAASYGKKVGEIAYIFVDDEEILNAVFNLFMEKNADEFQFEQ